MAFDEKTYSSHCPQNVGDESVSMNLNVAHLYSSSNVHWHLARRSQRSPDHSQSCAYCVDVLCLYVPVYRGTPIYATLYIYIESSLYRAPIYKVRLYRGNPNRGPVSIRIFYIKDVLGRAGLGNESILARTKILSRGLMCYLGFAKLGPGLVLRPPLSLFTYSSWFFVSKVFVLHAWASGPPKAK